MARTSKALDAYLEFGFTSQRSRPHITRKFHRHNEVELEFIESGSMVYLFANGALTFQAGMFVVFWGAMPHQLLSYGKGTVNHWLTIPLAWFLQWDLPDRLVRRVLDGGVIIEEDSNRRASDQAMFERWHEDLNASAPEHQKLVMLEAEVRLRRLAISTFSREAFKKGRRRSGGKAPGMGFGKVERMAQHIAKHYMEPLRVAEVAGVVGLHPDYAVTLFRKTCGMSLVDYIVQHRVSHAQRLLATTEMNILDIAFASGFGSASRFYAVFEKEAGCAPKTYRRMMKKKIH